MVRRHLEESSVETRSVHKAFLAGLGSYVMAIQFYSFSWRSMGFLPYKHPDAGLQKLYLQIAAEKVDTLPRRNQKQGLLALFLDLLSRASSCKEPAYPFKTAS